MEKSRGIGGRPPHMPDDKNRRIVELLAGAAIPQRDIAVALGINCKSLRRHYRRELDRGAAHVEAELVGNLLRLANGDDGVALNAIAFALRSRFGWSEFAPPRV
jgi:hypothetical protein